MKLRDYQLEASEDIEQKHGNGYRGVLLPFATGLGKTVVMGDLYARRRKRGRRVLFMAHLRELLDGASATFGNFWNGDTHFFERGEEYVPSTDIRSGRVNTVFAMVQSLRGRLEKYPTDYFDDIFIDETHHSVAKTYMSITNHFKDAKITGVTATPKRADKLGLKAIFDSTSDCKMSVTDGIALGWLAPLRPVSYKVESLDYSDVTMNNGGDYNQNQIEAALQRNGCKPLHEIAAGLQDMAKDLQSIVFVSGVGSAQVLAKIMREDYNEPVDFIYGGTDYEARASIIERYRRGDIKRIINVGVLTEGVDLPNTRCVAIARITRSEGRYLQMAGRGTRPYPPGIVDLYSDPRDRCNAIAASLKPDCLLLDFKGNMGRVKPCIDGVDLLAGLLPHYDYGERPRPSKEDVMAAGAKPENNGKTIDELRQAASDDLFLDLLIKNFSVKASVKLAEVTEHAGLFGAAHLPEDREKVYQPLPEAIRADSDQRAQIIWLRKKVGMPPPTTEYLMTTSRTKALRVIADLIKRAHDPQKWLQAKRKKEAKKRAKHATK